MKRGLKTRGYKKLSRNKKEKGTDVQDFALKGGMDEHYVEEYRVNKKLLGYGNTVKALRQGDQETLKRNRAWNYNFTRNTFAKRLDYAEV